MSMYNVIKALIAKGKTDGLEAKIDMFYAVGKLTDEQYKELLALLPVAE